MLPPSCTAVSTTQPSPATSVEHLLVGHDATEHKDFCDKVDEGEDVSNLVTSASTGPEEKVPLRIVWKNVILFAYLHLVALYGTYLVFTSLKWQSNVFGVFVGISAGVGVTAGAHRLWSHRSYKAKLPLRILLAFMFTIASQNDIYVWCRDHRVHHKYTETDADPHNARRGFFFSHVGWLLCRKHPDVLRKGKNVDMSDVLADPVVKFQKQYYWRLVFVCSILLPTLIPMYFWNESFLNAFLGTAIFRLCCVLNQTWLVNSAAHIWGNRPYDENIDARDNLLASLGFIGDAAFHNFHHTFPYDYASSEFGMKYNIPAAFINLMAFLGLAYDLKTASRESIKSRKLRTGEDRLKHQKINSPKTK